MKYKYVKPAAGNLQMDPENLMLVLSETKANPNGTVLSRRHIWSDEDEEEY